MTCRESATTTLLKSARTRRGLGSNEIRAELSVMCRSSSASTIRYFLVAGRGTSTGGLTHSIAPLVACRSCSGIAHRVPCARAGLSSAPDIATGATRSRSLQRSGDSARGRARTTGTLVCSAVSDREQRRIASWIRVPRRGQSTAYISARTRTSITTASTIQPAIMAGGATVPTTPRTVTTSSRAITPTTLRTNRVLLLICIVLTLLPRRLIDIFQLQLPPCVHTPAPGVFHHPLPRSSPASREHDRRRRVRCEEGHAPHVGLPVATLLSCTIPPNVRKYNSFWSIFFNL